MGHGDYHWGLYRDYYRDPFPHSIPSTREQSLNGADSRLLLKDFGVEDCESRPHEKTASKGLI